MIPRESYESLYRELKDGISYYHKEGSDRTIVTVMRGAGIGKISNALTGIIELKRKELLLTTTNPSNKEILIGAVGEIFTLAAQDKTYIEGKKGIVISEFLNMDNAHIIYGFLEKKLGKKVTKEDVEDVMIQASKKVLLVAAKSGQESVIGVLLDRYGDSKSIFDLAGIVKAIKVGAGSEHFTPVNAIALKNMLQKNIDTCSDPGELDALGKEVDKAIVMFVSGLDAKAVATPEGFAGVYTRLKSVFKNFDLNTIDGLNDLARPVQNILNAINNEFDDLIKNKPAVVSPMAAQVIGEVKAVREENKMFYALLTAKRLILGRIVQLTEQLKKPGQSSSLSTYRM